MNIWPVVQRAVPALTNAGARHHRLLSTSPSPSHPWRHSVPPSRVGEGAIQCRFVQVVQVGGSVGSVGQQCCLPPEANAVLVQVCHDAGHSAHCRTGLVMPEGGRASWWSHPCVCGTRHPPSRETRNPKPKPPSQKIPRGAGCTGATRTLCDVSGECFPFLTNTTRAPKTPSSTSRCLSRPPADRANPAATISPRRNKSGARPQPVRGARPVSIVPRGSRPACQSSTSLSTPHWNPRGQPLLAPSCTRCGSAVLCIRCKSECGEGNRFCGCVG